MTDWNLRFWLENVFIIIIIIVVVVTIMKAILTMVVVIVMQSLSAIFKRLRVAFKRCHFPTSQNFPSLQRWLNHIRAVRASLTFIENLPHLKFHSILLPNGVHGISAVLAFFLSTFSSFQESSSGQGQYLHAAWHLARGVALILLLPESPRGDSGAVPITNHHMSSYWHIFKFSTNKQNRAR